MPDANNSQTNRRRPGHPAWLANLYQDVAHIIGQQLAAQYQAPQELPADMAALVMRMDESKGVA